MRTRFARLIQFLPVLCLVACDVAPRDAAQTVAVTGDPGTTHVIESKNGVEDDSWVTRGVVELTSTQDQWIDSVPPDGPERIYRAVKVNKPEGVQPIEGMVWIPAGSFTMGSPASEQGRSTFEGPQTLVTLTQSYWIGKSLGIL